MEAFDVVDECLECRTWLSKVSVLGSSGRGRWRYDWRNPSRNALLGCGTRWAGRGVGGSSGWLFGKYHRLLDSACLLGLSDVSI